MNTTLSKNEIYESVIEGYTSEALGVCHINGQAVFVPGGIAGERVKVRITKANSSVAYGRLEELVSVSEHRSAPQCPYYKQCGGCNTSHMDYEEELRFKLEKVNSCLERIGRQTVFADSILPSEETFEYRNKVTFSVASDDSGNYYGFYSPRSHRVVNIQECNLQKPVFCNTAEAVIRFLNLNQFPAYDENTQKGYVRHIFIRCSSDGSSVTVCITSAKGFGAKTDSLVVYLRKECPYLTGIVLNINKEPGNELLNGEFYTLYGNPNVTSELCGFSFNIAPRAFYQVNSGQAEILYNTALSFLSESNKNTVLDLYCGIGTISLCLSRLFNSVIGVEIVQPAVDNARENAKNNGVKNAEFICADTAEALKILKERDITPDAVVVDPPRKGMDARAINIIAEMKPENIVYISCNPATLARDLLIFNENGYNTKRVTAVDMFPGTFHVETVVLMSRYIIDN